MNKIEIDFNNLKYNLYELLNISEDANKHQIKKQFIKIIKNFHPDKNSELEEDIYHHIILAHQILINSESRFKYNNYINNKALTYLELKDSYNKNKNKIYTTDKFDNIENNLNISHGYNIDKYQEDQESVINKFTKLKNNNNIYQIPKEKFNSMNDFNLTFSNKNNTSIVEYTSPSELSNYIIGEIYTNINDIDKLYIEDTIESSKFTSLDKAYNLLPNIIPINTNKTNEEKINDYKNFTKNNY